METRNTTELISILLIDDDVNIINGMSHIIEEAFPGAFQISKAYDGHQAVKLLESCYFPIIISDIMMPLDRKSVV